MSKSFPDAHTGFISFKYSKNNTDPEYFLFWKGGGGGRALPPSFLIQAGFKLEVK